ncbi:MAG: Holliday junction resolvase RuvX [Acidobacteriota bacterium]
MTRILALDLGEKRVGVALSDPLGITAQPLGKCARQGGRRDNETVERLVQEHRVNRIVVGLPLRLDGTAGRSAARARRFANQLRRRLPIPVELWDERLTTVEAERLMIRDGVRRRQRLECLDAMAAVLILQSWLDAHRD